MKLRRLLPYLLTIAVFSLAYFLTMIIPNKTLYLGYGQDWQEVIRNNKIPLHREIFGYGLPFAILIINFLEIITTRGDKFFIRLTKSLLTVLLTYFFSGLIYLLLDSKIWNMYWYPRGAPYFGFYIATNMWTALGLVILEGIKRIYPKNSR